MLVQREDEFVITRDGRNAARLQFIPSEEIGLVKNVLIIEHTVVFEEFKGNGYGRELIYALVDYARIHSKKIEPQCPFAKVIFEKTPEIQDVLAR